MVGGCDFGGGFNCTVFSSPRQSKANSEGIWKIIAKRYVNKIDEA